jgi:signal transduction histidine kinase
MGVLDIESPERDAFNKEDMLRLSLFASQIASAINNANLFEELQTANKELHEANLQLDYKAMELGTSQRILEGISRKLEPESILQAISLPLKELIPFTALSLFLIGSRNNLLIVERDGTTTSNSTDILANDIMTQLRKTKMVAKEILDRPVEEYVFGKGLVPMGQNVSATTLCFPLVGENGIFGALHISDGRRDAFDEEEVTFLRNVTSQISLGLSRLFSIREYQDRMEEISRMKADFSSCMSHELRTPITSLKNSIDILLSGKAGNLDQRQSHFMTLAKRDVSRLIDMINNVLDLSMLESGSFVINQKGLEVADSLEAALEKVDEFAQEKSITFVRRVTRPLPRLYADTERLEQILVNLLSNAIKFSENGGKVQVSASLVTDVTKRLPSRRKLPRGWKASSVSHNGNGRLVSHGEGSKVPLIEISVRDWGTGISQERLDMIFDKFTQEDSSMTRTARGVGLGLTLTGHLTTAHNGLLWAESKPGEGSVFRCLLPACKEEILATKNS